ncbi:hypothetical protein BJ944DRAFT_263037 [Cunninghamella echinulata]|nr:hypothetical protein BJ944DRAFT_263037 [Cunninghamella echinulata]
MLKNIFNFILFFLFFSRFKVQSQFVPTPRGWAGCSLVDSTIHCFGGLTAFYQKGANAGQDYNLTTEHITLDLSQYKSDFSNFDRTKVEWKLLSNKVNVTNNPTLQGLAEIGSAPIYSDNSFLIYGGEQDGYGGNASINFPFAHYNSQSDIWNPKNISNDDYYASHTTLVNLGNDTIWIWGGYEYATLHIAPNKLKLYDYKSSKWTIGPTMKWKPRADHTATLTNNGMIYILGGLITYMQNGFEQVDYVPLQNITTFNSNTMEWKDIIATGDQATFRIAHTTTFLPDKNLLMVYGGFVFNIVGSYSSPDPCYIYDIEKNSYKRITFPALDSTNLRYAHFATLYGNNSLVMALGFTHDNIGGDSLSILNITDPYNPSWLGTPSILPPESTPSVLSENNNGLNQQSKIAIIVVMVIVAVVGIIGIFFFYRSRKRKQKKAFALDTDGTTVSNTTDSQDVYCKPLGVNNNEIIFTKAHDLSPDENICKPYESK